MFHLLNMYFMSNNLILSNEVWARLAAVTPEEKEKALKKLARWITYEIVHRGFDLDYGPFSYAAMGGNAVEVISQECYDALFGGEWHWKPTRELSSMLIQIAKSKMGHIIRDWHAQGQPDIKLQSGLSYREQVEMDIARQWEAEANMRELHMKDCVAAYGTLVGICRLRRGFLFPEGNARIGRVWRRSLLAGLLAEGVEYGRYAHLTETFHCLSCLL